jgi:DNA (cytosine-5)-methyltransferase 1
MWNDWKLTDLKSVKKNGKKVFSCFACGGGSSMGYKKSGFEMVGINEIDAELIEIYKANFPNTQHFINQPIQEFVKEKKYPKELFDLDVLDGSPPCSSFSMSGSREKAWGKKKHFREGQTEQILDDLFFHFIELAKDLQPKVVVAENVKGMLAGNARGYVKQIFRAFDVAGYNTQLFLLNAASMGVPQRRERIFFIAVRKDIKKKISLSFNEDQITYDQIRKGDGIKGKPYPGDAKLWEKKIVSDKTIADINMRLTGKNSRFNAIFLKKHLVPNTLTSGSQFIDFYEKRVATANELIRIQSFPIDYDFIKNKYNNIKYILGMSVPPVMMEKVAKEVYNQILK